MSNHVKIGPLVIRIGSKYLAPWGFPRVQLWGLSFWSRTNSPGLVTLAAYHPRSSITWLWAVYTETRRPWRLSLHRQRRMPWKDNTE